MNFNMIQIGNGFGDGTAPYEVAVTENGTVEDFIDAVIGNCSDEWGYIGIKADGHIFGKPNMEYRYGKTINREALKAFESLPFKNITASGGWSRMDYLIELN